MASKSQSQTHDNTGTLILAEYPACVSLASSVLASVIPLRGHETVACYVYAPASMSSQAGHLDLLESARRTVIQKYNQNSLLDSLLPYVRVTGDTPALYIFAFGTLGTLFPHGTLSKLHLDGLELSSSSIFPVQDIYACSPSCSDLPSACADFPAGSASECSGLLPRQSLQVPLQYLLHAIRERAVDNVTASLDLHRTAMAFKDGFIMFSSSPSSDWSTGWDRHARQRPLIYCHLQVHLMPHPARIVVHPILRSTFYLELPAAIPVPSGTPIVLLPYGAPAYYLTNYTGPSAALTAQFDEALHGRGVKNWKNRAQSSDGATSKNGPSYIIAWISVQNRQGEDKGVTIIWPSSLCLSYHPSSHSPHARGTLRPIPDLPAQLQASPPPPPPSVPSILMSLSADSASVPEAGRPRTPPPTTASLSRRRTLLSSPSSDAVNAFRALSLGAKPFRRDLPSTASDVSAYVDAVAKERERERERIKRERENAVAKSRTPSSSNVLPATAAPAQPETLPPPVQTTPPVMHIEPPSPVLLHDDAPAGQAMEIDPEDNDPQHSSSGSLFSPPLSSQELPSTEDVPEPPADPTPDTTSPLAVQLAADSSQAGPSTFDPFAGFDSAWAHNQNSLMDMQMDYDIGFNMDIGSMGGVQSGTDVASHFSVDEDFNFTDDDFNFFDAPASQANAPAATQPLELNLGFALPTLIASMTQPTLITDGLNTSGPGPPSVVYGQPSPWVAPTPTEFPSPLHTDFPPAPDLLPPSPTRTLTTHSVPATPSVQFSEPDDFLIIKSVQASGSPTIFDPIPFSTVHKLTDGKYVVGKFALPSPPDDADRTEDLPIGGSGGGWKARYTAATDPRIGIVRKLIGVKRKGGAHGQRVVRAVPAWLREHEEWESVSDTPLEVEAKSESESDDDEPWADDDDAKTASRPLTPPPSYLPMGPTLLHTQFHHSRLLPLGGPVRPSGAAPGGPHVNTPPMSVPTPVSPTAVLGAASEKSKSLEAAAQILVKEVVENATWAHAWRIGSIASASGSKPPTQVWPADVRDVALRLSRCFSGHVPTLQDVFLPEVHVDASLVSALPLQLMDPPMFAVGKSDVVVQVLPPALRFWEKLGLGPRSGRKGVCAYVFFEEAGDEREAEIGEWLDRVSSAYSAKSYGEHSPGHCDSYVKPGLVPVKFDSIKKTLVNFASSLPPQPTSSNLVFYIVIPSPVISLSSQPLRHIFSAVKRALKTHTDTQILFQFVPETLITAALADPRTHHAGLEPFVDSVYNRILQPIDRLRSRPLLAHGPPVRAYFHAPAFALARPLTASSAAAEQLHRARVSFSLEPHTAQVDVLDRHALLHVGYAVSPCGRWLLAACVDARGEEHDLGAWLVPEEELERFVVDRVWEFVHDFARRANVEWRIVVAKSGAMSPAELTAWTIHLNTMVTLSSDAPPLHVTLLIVEHELGWTLLTPNSQPGPKLPSPPLSHRPASRSHTASVLTDISSTTYALFPPNSPSPVPVPHTADTSDAIPGAADISYVPDVDEDERSERPEPAMLARRMSVLITVPAGTDYTAIETAQLFLLHTARSPRSTYGRDVLGVEAGEQGAGVQRGEEETLRHVTRNFYELTVLARARWRLDAAPALPFHLAALEVMKTTLSGEVTE